MTDQPRKLPVLAIESSGLETLKRLVAQYGPGAVVRLHVSDDALRSACELYEPTVPRCRTCPNFQTDCDDNGEHSVKYCSNQCDGEDATFPQDGSGYCWLHPDASHD